MKIINRNKEAIMGKYDYPINDLTPCGNSAEVVCKDFV